MVLFIGYHATSRSRRASIESIGLSVDFSMAEPPGVYVFDPYMSNGEGSSAQECAWDFGPNNDLWRVAYCGPMIRDECLRNAVILPSVQDVTLVTGNK